jgi:hypothetical protein
MDNGIINIHFTNGAGNNLFQYIFARMVSEAKLKPLSYPALPVLGLPASPKKFPDGIPVRKIVGSSKKPINYHNLLQPDVINGKDIKQSYDLKVYPEDFTLYNHPNRIEDIRMWFEMPPITNHEDLLLHVRLGDRLLMKSTYQEENFIPFSEMREGIESFKFNRLFIVTDMPVWKQVTAGEVGRMKFHRDVKPKDRADLKVASDYFNSIYAGLQMYQPKVRCGNSVTDDFHCMLVFDQFMFTHGTLPWWAAALSGASNVALYGRWRGGKDINLGWTDFPGWRQWGRKTAPTRGVKDYHLKRLAKEHDLKIFVETGTRGGTTLKSMVETGRFESLHSVEIIKKAYDKVQGKFYKHSEVRLYLGDSAKVLPRILENVNKPTLFWLDAHDGKFSTPILDEIRHILPTKQKHVLVMDDMRYFGTQEAYPTVQEVIDLVKELQPEATVDVKFDSIRVFC